jgi:hypothetical protein
MIDPTYCNEVQKHYESRKNLFLIFLRAVITKEGMCTGVCRQFVNKGLALASYVFVLISGSRDGQDVSIYMDACISIFLYWCIACFIDIFCTDNKGPG